MFEFMPNSVLFSSAEKAKLAGIETGAQVNPADSDAITEGAAKLFMTTTERAKVGDLSSQTIFVSYTAVAGDDVAGYADVDTGFGVAPDAAVVQVRRAGVDVMVDAIVSYQAGGAVRVADGGVTYVVTAGDEINVIAWKV